jgi:hypothetical protein
MATLDRSVASLRITGDDLEPSTVSALLGVKPTRSHVKGAVLHSRPGRTRTARFGLWSLDAEDASPADLNEQVLGLLSRLPTEQDTWHQLGASYEVDLFCGWFMGVINEGTSIQADTLSALGSRGIALSIDLYGPPDETDG